MSTDPKRRHTRAATTAGIFPAPKLPRDTPSPTPPSSRASVSGVTGSPKSRPVTPELLYSVVASAVSLSRGVSPVACEGQGDVPDSASALSELPSLTRDVDYGSAHSVSPISTIVHGETMSVHINDIDLDVNQSTPPPPRSAESNSVSTVSKAVQDMSREELVSLARRYESMARDAMAEANRKLSAPSDAEPYSGLEDDTHRHEFISSSAIPSGEGPSRNKGKGPDPRNWGDAGFSADFSEQDIAAQHEALNNFAEINRAVKEERPTRFKEAFK
ncbi:hypothetical protein B0H15DRAFT_806475 [Mycena belliarum]|uniref:Uncharacterized protein n=1 Tax=Mycena belliarum TaxID=1033014 RepID=A0AAD6TPR0_9AGAR|nr:hypothetical protein B0H15DRAFT_806475 [Mycena belliae]